jgi:CBS domain-containing protein
MRAPIVRFHIDPETGEPHIYKHEVTEEEVEEILRSPGDDFPGRAGSRIALGATGEGRHLQVVYVPDSEGHGVFVVTAYDLRGKALAAYRRRRRRR